MHYVSPSVWAWRAKRVRKMRGNIDLMLTLFPFEVDFYRQHGITAEFVGHPLADEVAFDASRATAREQLGLPQDKRILAHLAGKPQRGSASPCRRFLASSPAIATKIPGFAGGHARRQPTLAAGTGNYPP